MLCWQIFQSRCLITKGFTHYVIVLHHKRQRYISCAICSYSIIPNKITSNINMFVIREHGPLQYSWSSVCLVSTFHAFRLTSYSMQLLARYVMEVYDMGMPLTVSDMLSRLVQHCLYIISLHWSIPPITLSCHLASCHTCTCHTIVGTNFVYALQKCEILSTFPHDRAHMYIMI